MSIASSAVRWPRSGSSSRVGSQSRLDEQQVRLARELDHRVARPGVAGVHEAGPVGRLDGHRPGRDVVAATPEADRERADDQRGVRVVLVDGIRGVEEMRPLRDRLGQGVDPAAAARWQVDRQANRRLLAPREDVPKAGQIEEMVGMHVADDDPGQIAGVHEPLEPADDALSGVEQDRRPIPVDEEARRRRRGVRDRRAAAEHGQPEAARTVGSHGDILWAARTARGRKTDARCVVPTTAKDGLVAGGTMGRC